jgi:hypothetical protein
MLETVEVAYCSILYNWEIGSHFLVGWSNSCLVGLSDKYQSFRLDTRLQMPAIPMRCALPPGSKSTCFSIFSNFRPLLQLACLPLVP